MKIKIMNVLFLTAADFDHPNLKHVSDLSRKYLIDKKIITKAELVIVRYKGESRIIKNRNGAVDTVVIPSRLHEDDSIFSPIDLPTDMFPHIKISDNTYSNCLHDSCISCHGTGVRIDGSMCIHSLSCPCPKCTPRC